MKILYSLFLATTICSTSFAQVKAPAPSPTQKITQDFALSSVELSYSRPGIKNRKIFGELVPFGKVWRTGANQATTIYFGQDVTIGGTKIPAGKYGLLSIPGQTEWTVIITKSTDVTSPDAYKQDNDVVRVKVKPRQIPSTIETFTITFDNVKPSSMSLSILWDKTMVSVPINTDVAAK